MVADVDDCRANDWDSGIGQVKYYEFLYCWFNVRPLRYCPMDVPDRCGRYLVHANFRLSERTVQIRTWRSPVASTVGKVHGTFYR